MHALAALVVAVVQASGLYGVVTRGPTAPVCRVGQPCSAPAAGVRVTFTRGSRSFAVTTAHDGRYRIALPPGVYAVSAGPRLSIGRGLEPAIVRVQTARYAHVNFSIDTGIR